MLSFYVNSHAKLFDKLSTYFTLHCRIVVIIQMRAHCVGIWDTFPAKFTLSWAFFMAILMPFHGLLLDDTSTNITFDTITPIIIMCFHVYFKASTDREKGLIADRTS